MVQEDVFAPALQEFARNCEKEDFMRVEKVEAKVFAMKYGPILLQHGYDGKRLIEDMWFRSRRSLKDRLIKPLPISHCLEMAEMRNELSGMDYF